MKIIAIVKNSKNTWTITEENKVYKWYQSDLTVPDERTTEEQMWDIMTDMSDYVSASGEYKTLKTAIKKAASFKRPRNHYVSVTFDLTHLTSAGR